MGDGRLIDELPAGVELVSTIVSQGVLSSVAGRGRMGLGTVGAGIERERDGDSGAAADGAIDQPRAAAVGLPGFGAPGVDL